MKGKKQSFLSTLVTVSIVTLLFTGCASVEQAKTMPNDPDFAPILPEMEDVPLVPTGSLFNVNYVNNIYSDSKAHRVGDIISVILSESTQANKNAKTELKKDNGASMSPITGIGGAAINFNNKALQFGYDQTSNFKGDSKADQSNSLAGNISVHVLRVLPNGNLMIRGEKWMSLNNGDEYIRLTGIVRSQDISSDNTVTSSKVANARIEYAGTGTFADVQEQGWLSKFFNSSWWPL
ncbi:flagellar basal body L-ring protein FlgH [Cognaticolwellia beringensis]|uniref:Flagellar L-ring protein n=1 Tax=Cognaticolwellia beringensis TaxID=1967665 RepID=A0A222G4A9_9GAMM|nr:flagellar basal body L-ring protein FlgH [Cognaticolwellia beringensis]ASP46572.1 flagellar basal body L-ring protein [Cognaticolwellia beringensis]|tara:strand:- start:12401 stop:13108 length:708 start_codon:yes stop_codon:yes gene_type:complete